MKREIDYYERIGIVPQPGTRRPDFRSSGPKRLLPQLEIKVPTLRRWGKKMFVAIDRPFMEWLPDMRMENDISNADICWLAFSLDTSSSPYKLELHSTCIVTLEASRKSLVAGTAPPKSEFEKRVRDAMRKESKIAFSDQKHYPET